LQLLVLILKNRKNGRIPGSLHAEHERTLLNTSALQSKVEDLAATNRDQERRLDDDERFLASDRDIRELMGARKLYMPEVFDVDSGSRPRKPYGRVFYTQNKSLIFYLLTSITRRE
jgi:hypothetical protein